MISNEISIDMLEDADNERVIQLLSLAGLLDFSLPSPPQAIRISKLIKLKEKVAC